MGICQLPDAMLNWWHSLAVEVTQHGSDSGWIFTQTYEQEVNKLMLRLHPVISKAHHFFSIPSTSHFNPPLLFSWFLWNPTKYPTWAAGLSSKPLKVTWESKNMAHSCHALNAIEPKTPCAPLLNFGFANSCACVATASNGETPGGPSMRLLVAKGTTNRRNRQGIMASGFPRRNLQTTNDQRLEPSWDSYKAKLPSLGPKIRNFLSGWGEAKPLPPPNPRKERNSACSILWGAATWNMIGFFC